MVLTTNHKSLNFISDMATIAQDSRTVRIREDVWDAARRRAFHGEMTIVEVLDTILRKHFRLPAVEAGENEAA